MCVIIHRSPGVELPFDKLKSACIVNPDGFGVVIPDRGKLEMRRVYDPKGNNAEALAKLLEDAKDLNVYAHLRYKTKGATDLDNVHPFTVVSKKKDGIDVQFMHNGTLSEFGNAQFCDSKVFAIEIVRPLYRMVAAKVGKERALYDPLFGKLLAKYAGTQSVFTLVDSLGNALIVNRKQGYEFDWGWASNKYSFDRTHREPTWSTSYYDSKAYYDYKRSSVQEDKPKDSGPAGGTRTAKAEADLNDPLPWDPPATTLPSVITKNNVQTIVAKKTLTDPNPRQTFLDVAELHDLQEVTSLTRDNIEELVAEYPEHACLLIQDLIAELYHRTNTMKEAA